MKLFTFLLCPVFWQFQRFVTWLSVHPSIGLPLCNETSSTISLSSLKLLPLYNNTPTHPFFDQTPIFINKFNFSTTIHPWLPRFVLLRGFGCRRNWAKEGKKKEREFRKYILIAGGNGERYEILANMWEGTSPCYFSQEIVYFSKIGDHCWRGVWIELWVWTENGVLSSSCISFCYLLYFVI